MARIALIAPNVLLFYGANRLNRANKDPALGCADLQTERATHAKKTAY